MRIAILADIHGNLPALEAVVRDLERRGADVVVNLGDSLSGPLLPRETAAFLMAQGWVHVAGNHERQMLTDRPDERGPSDEYALTQVGEREAGWMASLPAIASLGDDVLLCHGSPRSDSEYLLETVEPTGVRLATAGEVGERLGGASAPVVACGHTHVPRVVHAPSGQLVVNPGSVGVQGFTDTVPFPHAIETGSPDARYAILERIGAAWTAALVTVPYDHRSMARLARERRRPDWERALLSGYLR